MRDSSNIHFAKGCNTILGSLDNELVEGVVLFESLVNNASQDDDGISSILLFNSHNKFILRKGLQVIF